jgi:hypothetical protein
MSAPVIELETQDLVAAARRLELWSADPLAAATSRLCAVLIDSYAMAGSDPGGSSWAAAYDPAAHAASYAAQDAVNSVHRLAAMFAQTARNYAAADVASTSGVRRRLDEAVAAVPVVHGYALPACLPSAAGGAGDPPAGWGLVCAAVGWVWPDGHQDKLRATARAWRESGATLGAAADRVVEAGGPAIGDRLPEADDIWRVCAALADRLREVGEVHAALAVACDELAGHLDHAHHEVLAELQSLLEWTATIEAGSAVLSVFTFGISEAVGQGVEASRIAAAAARIASIIERFTAIVRSLAQSIGELAERADRVAGAMTGLLEARLTTAVLTQVRTTPSMLHIQEWRTARRLGAPAGSFPELSVTTAQLESKFKHAAAFGVSLRRSRAGFEAFEEAVGEFLAGHGTRRVVGLYRGREAILSYRMSSRLVVIQDLDGRFVSCWRLRRAQILHVARDRRLGGG